MIYVMSGGQMLNFKVVNGTSAPSSPSENALWVNTSVTIPSWDFSPVQPPRRSGNKNLLVYPYDSGASLTSAGITFTCNSSGHVTVNGSATANVFYRIFRNEALWLDPGTYTISGCPAQPSSGNAYVLYVYDDIAGTTLASDYGTGKTFTLTKRAEVSVSIQVISGKTASSAVFMPQLEKASAATSFVTGNATGQVWLQTAESGDIAFNALKKDNGIWLYLNACKQYDGSAWVSRALQVYQGGAWTELPNELVLFDSSVTSGWAAKYTASGYGSASISGGVMTLTGSRVSGNDANNYTTLYYNTTARSKGSYTKLNVTVTGLAATESGVDDYLVARLLMQSSPTAIAGTATTNVIGEVEITGTGTFSVTLPSSSFYVGLLVNGWTKLIVSKVWLS